MYVYDMNVKGDYLGGNQWQGGGRGKRVMKG
jgi:hypothetical protein